MTSNQDKPIRIQRKRTKGWKMPPNTVYVGRPSKWGNFYKHSPHVSRKEAVGFYKVNVLPRLSRADIKNELRGKDLACWCPLVDDKGNKVPCHADVLLELANQDKGEI